ncbi:MAG: hypothetical protein JNK46_19780 [Methylobacteriaceae bacterium]|nr:hypothetical protein [Methylobacteriaceae bacterium]
MNILRAPLPADLTPLAAELGVTPLYGDIHNHCDLSYGHGRFEDALARAALQLDFVSITGHAHWPDMPVDDPSVAHIVAFHVEGFARLRRRWPEHFAALQAANGPRLVVFPGYEIHSGAYGDYTIVYRDLDPAPMILADSPAELAARLRAEMPERAFAFPHHIGYRPGARGVNWDVFDPTLSPFVEMNSMHGCAEASETDRPYLHSMGPVDGRQTMQAGLARGKLFGVVGNTDHHSAFPGSYGHGRMAVYAHRRDRAAIWDAMLARRTNALTGDSTHLLAAIGATMQGGVVAPSRDATLRVEAVSGGFIDAIDVIRDGRLAHRVTPELTPAPISPRPLTTLYLEFGWGARGRSFRWEGEIGLDGGAILSVTPRFRGAEIVSPLEGEDGAHPLPSLATTTDGRVIFAVTAEANPNNVTAATQGLLLRCEAGDDARLRADLNGHRVELRLAELFEAGRSGNLGPIDSPAWRIHAAPRPANWQWRGEIALGAIAAGETIYLRLRQRDGQRAWTSPFFVRG